MNPVSILIPLYNGIEFLDECLASIQSQTHENWEVIIGVNGHNETSPVYLQAKTKECEKIRVVLYDTKGKPNTMNQMVHDVRHDIICLLDVDDFWEPTKLQDQLKFVEEYDVIGTHTIYIKNGRRSGQPRIPIGEVKDFISCNPMISSSLMLRRQDCHWNDVVLDDYDLVLRLASEGKRFYNVHKPLTLHRLHSKSFFNSKGNHSHVKKTLDKWRYKIQDKR